MRIHRFVPFLVVVLCLTVVGCGKQLADVSGTVKYQGKLITTGTVLFRGADNLDYYGPIDDKGQYKAKVAVGQAKVQFNCIDEKAQIAFLEAAKKATQEGLKSGKPGAGMPKMPPGGFSLVPEKYNDISTSDTSVVIKSGSNTHDFDLK